MKIFIETIPHKEQRYVGTPGDYFYEGDNINDGDTLLMKISKFDDWRMGFLVALHELIEWALAKDRGITIEQIDEFDMNYKGDYDEMGNDPACPIHREHVFANNIEAMMCHEFGINWDFYDKKVMELE